MGPRSARHCCCRRRSVLAPPLGTLGLDHVSPNEVVRNKRPFGPPAALKGFIAKRSFGALHVCRFGAALPIGKCRSFQLASLHARLSLRCCPDCRSFQFSWQFLSLFVWVLFATIVFPTEFLQNLSLACFSPTGSIKQPLVNLSSESSCSFAHKRCHQYL